MNKTTEDTLTRIQELGEQGLAFLARVQKAEKKVAALVESNERLREDYRKLAHQFCYDVCDVRWEESLFDHTAPCRLSHTILAELDAPASAAPACESPQGCSMPFTCVDTKECLYVAAKRRAAPARNDAPGNNRCVHGVWLADHCYKCKTECAPDPDAPKGGRE